MAALYNMVRSQHTTYKTISLAKDEYSNITVILILMSSKVISVKSMTEM